jgi:phosphoadenosine phosphosulfate reductase
MILDRKKLQRFDEVLTKMQPLDILSQAIGRFRSRMMITSSFGAESGVLLHMISRIDRGVPIYFIDTGYHFEETLDYKDTLVRSFGLSNVKALRSPDEKRRQLYERCGHEPFKADPDLCCHINKVEPLHSVFGAYNVWVSGIRREQTSYRKGILFAERHLKRLYKIHPLLRWTSADILKYLKKHDIPRHPLEQQGYASIGCRPCTEKISDQSDRRSGRWSGSGKTECGIHQRPSIKESSR